MNTLTPYAEHWDAMREAHRNGEGLWLDANAIAVAVGCGVSSVGVFDYVATHRDADYVTESNHAVGVQLLRDVADGEGVTVLRFSCSVAGWIDHVLIDTSRADIVKACDAIREKLDAYSVLDEGHACEVEWAQNHPRAGECYAESGEDCPCHDQAAA